SRLRAAMDDAAWDRHLPAPALQRQYDALRQGHCGLLPEAQLVPMARMQIARDASLARTVQQALHPGQSVLLLAGNGHVLRRLGGHQRQHRRLAWRRLDQFDVVDGGPGALGDPGHRRGLRGPAGMFRQAHDPVHQNPAALASEGHDRDVDAVRLQGAELAHRGASSGNSARRAR
ncbi:ChaN family lipoprotein, partial [Verminephrobacter sp. Larva24]